MSLHETYLFLSGNKQNNLDVVYTMWANLKKTANMDVGQVGFHNDKEVRLQITLSTFYYISDLLIIFPGRNVQYLNFFLY